MVYILFLHHTMQKTSPLVYNLRVRSDYMYSELYIAMHGKKHMQCKGHRRYCPQTACRPVL